MAQGTNNHVLQQISISEWESQRVRDVDELAAALAHTVAASSALPRHTQAGQPDLGRAATELRTELRARLNAKSPFTRKARSQRAVAHLQARMLGSAQQRGPQRRRERILVDPVPASRVARLGEECAC